ncbi:MAG: hypothetical protein ACR2PT_21350 [Endozoicomonas sp.]
MLEQEYPPRKRTHNAYRGKPFVRGSRQGEAGRYSSHSSSHRRQDRYEREPTVSERYVEKQIKSARELNHQGNYHEAIGQLIRAHLVFDARPPHWHEKNDIEEAFANAFSGIMDHVDSGDIDTAKTGRVLPQLMPVCLTPFNMLSKIQEIKIERACFDWGREFLEKKISKIFESLKGHQYTDVRRQVHNIYNHYRLVMSLYTLRPLSLIWCSVIHHSLDEIQDKLKNGQIQVAVDQLQAEILPLTDLLGIENDQKNSALKHYRGLMYTAVKLAVKPDQFSAQRSFIYRHRLELSLRMLEKGKIIDSQVAWECQQNLSKLRTSATLSVQEFLTVDFELFPEFQNARAAIVYTTKTLKIGKLKSVIDGYIQEGSFNTALGLILALLQPALLDSLPGGIKAMLYSRLRIAVWPTLYDFMVTHQKDDNVGARQYGQRLVSALSDYESQLFDIQRRGLRWLKGTYTDDSVSDPVGLSPQEPAAMDLTVEVEGAGNAPQDSTDLEPEVSTQGLSMDVTEREESPHPDVLAPQLDEIEQLIRSEILFDAKQKIIDLGPKFAESTHSEATFERWSKLRIAFLKSCRLSAVKQEKGFDFAKARETLRLTDSIPTSSAVRENTSKRKLRLKSSQRLYELIQQSKGQEDNGETLLQGSGLAWEEQRPTEALWAELSAELRKTTARVFPRIYDALSQCDLKQAQSYLDNVDELLRLYPGAVKSLQHDRDQASKDIAEAAFTQVEFDSQLTSIRNEKEPYNFAMALLKFVGGMPEALVNSRKADIYKVLHDMLVISQDYLFLRIQTEEAWLEIVTLLAATHQIQVLLPQNALTTTGGFSVNLEEVLLPGLFSGRQVNNDDQAQDFIGVELILGRHEDFVMIYLAYALEVQEYKKAAIAAYKELKKKTENENIRQQCEEGLERLGASP